LIVSIVGCDRVPFGYYRAKATAEEVALRGPVPASVLRATQFHELVVRLAQASTLGPVTVVPRGLRAASLDVRDVADRVVRAVADGPGGRLPDLGGPEDLGLADVARMLAQARGRRPPRRLSLPAWGGFLRAFAEGANLPGPDAERGSRTLAAWVAERYPAERPGVEAQ
jgi:nucleoside-diphosphate-sugar epimerase